MTLTKGIGFIVTNIQICDKCAVISCKSSESDSLSEINVTTKKVIRSDAHYIASDVI